jgi:invasion protein IalB
MYKNVIIGAIALCLFSVGFAAAQQLQQTSGDWRVFTAGEGTARQCYIASVPVKKTGNYSARSEPFVMVTARALAGDEVSVSSGYPYKDGGQVSLTIDARRYDLFTQGDRGWAYDAEQDKNLVAAMMKGSQMEVKGTSQKGTFSADSYSLSGFTSAMQKMKALCR